MKRIFVCSPLRGDVDGNIANARRYCRFVASLGHLPYAPHLLFPQFLDDENPEERQAGIRMGLHELKNCDELWAFVTDGALSEGMRQEVRAAAAFDIPVRQFQGGPDAYLPQVQG